MLLEDGIVSRLQRLPDFQVARRDLLPRAHVASAAVLRAAMWNGFFNGRADTLEIVRKVTRVQIRLHSHHAAADVHSHSSGDNRALGGNHAANRGPIAQRAWLRPT